ncbi:MAG: threonyl-tRNA synthetase [Rhodothermales bacterium]|jgi:threonyl-tRNA synthetase
MKIDKDSPIYRLRHSLAHILAQAVLQIRPDAKMGFGPPVENGFYYDFDFGASPITENDLKDIQKRMIKIINQKQEFSEGFKSLEEAEALLAETDQSYKIEYAKELVETGKAENGQLGFYVNGPFIDMCEGPHLAHTGEVARGCFKLDKIAGSYWRGDEKRPMLTRIYGLAFEDKAALLDFQERRRLAEQRDHRKLGAELDIYAIDDEVGSGLPLWLPNGTILRDELEAWAKEVEFQAGYKRVSTPVITKSELYYRSGHLPYYKDAMFPPMKCDEDEEYYLRPMNCPHHHKVYASRPRSYRDLPFRLAEYGNNFRYERRGSLSGLLRVRAMCMNDAHIYCENDQVREEFHSIIKMYHDYYTHLRFADFRVCLSLHDPASDKFVGDQEEWERSEQIVREILQEAKIDFDEERGEAAFYGPKMDIQVRNLIGREETVSTCQLDFVMAERFDLEYTSRDGEAKRPYIIHRAPLSTHERFISFLIEFYGGAFPTWMSPNQVSIIPVGEHVADYAHEIHALLTSKLIRSEVDDSSAGFGKRVRNAIVSKTPNMWIIGGDEAESRSITWRRYSVKDQPTLPLDKAIDALLTMRSERMMDNFADVNIPV